jgi:hypothetical protein
VLGVAVRVRENARLVSTKILKIFWRGAGGVASTIRRHSSTTLWPNKFEAFGFRRFRARSVTSAGSPR